MAQNYNASEEVMILRRVKMVAFEKSSNYKNLIFNVE